MRVSEFCKSKYFRFRVKNIRPKTYVRGLKLFQPDEMLVLQIAVAALLRCQSGSTRYADRAHIEARIWILLFLKMIRSLLT